MKLATENQRFVAMLSEIASDENLPETVTERSRELIAEIKSLVDDEDDSSPSDFVEHIEYGFVEVEIPWGIERTYGLKVTGTNILLSEAMQPFEDLFYGGELPDSIKNYYPELTDEQWKAVIRMVIDVLTALDRRVLDGGAS